MDAIEKALSRVGDVKVANIPIGQALLLLAGLGISDILVPIGSKFLKVPMLSGAVMSVLVKLPVVSRIIGRTLSDVLAATSIATGLDEQFAIRERARGLVGGLVSKIGINTAGVRSRLAGVKTGAATAAPARVSLGQDFGLMSEPERRILATLKTPVGSS